MRIPGPIRIAAILAACALAPHARSQPAGEVRIHSGPVAPPSTLLPVQSNLVEISAMVRDRGGKLIGGFRRDDFELRASSP
jgi:hypothetical protein